MRTIYMKRFTEFLAVILLTSSAVGAHAQNVVISEFMAVNQSTLQDEDGDYSPWIEIRNASDQVVNLLGWSLTDDTNSPAKWVFPDTPLGPNQYLVVFASGKNRAVSGQELHANFKLQAAGGYLALRRPDTTIASQWNPYPVQAPDISYGTYVCVTCSVGLVTNGQAAAYFVPVSGIPTGWTNVQFDDSGWSRGPTPIGFDTAGSFRSYSDLMLAEHPLYYWNFNETSGPAINLVNPTNTQQALSPQGDATRLAETGLPLGSCASFDASSGTRFVTANLAAPEDLTPPWAVEFWFRDLSPSQATYFMEGETAAGGHNNPGLITGYTGQHIELYGASAGRTGSNGPVLSDTNWHHVVFGFLGSEAGDGLADSQQIYLDGRLADSCSNVFVSPLDFGAGGLAVGGTRVAEGILNGDMDEVAVYDLHAATNVAAATARLAALSSNHWNAVLTTNFGSVVATDIRNQMANQSSSLCLRYPVTVTNLDGLNMVRLFANYNDGFAVWLNGVRVLLVNAPTNLTYQSVALTNRTPRLALTASEFDLTAHVGLLHMGTNVLAIQALNSSPNSPEFLFQAELLLETGSTENGYIGIPSPGGANPDLEELTPGPTIWLQPQDQTALSDASATLAVFAAGASPLSYQWLLNGSAISAATNSSYSIPVLAKQDEGYYSVMVTDSTGTTVSQSAQLVVASGLQIITQPQSLSVAQGQCAAFSVSVNSDAIMPVRYQWYQGGTLIADFSTYSPENQLLLGPVTTTNAGSYTVWISNSAGSTSSVPASLTVLADSDGDGIPDSWMLEYFGHANGEAADNSLAQDDADGSGLNNLDKYLAGLNPTNPVSLFRLRLTGALNGFMLSFEAAPNHSYTVQQAASLPATNGWVTFQDIAARPATWNVQVNIPASNSNEFYRVVTPASGSRLVVAGAADNYLVQTLRANGANMVRFDSAADAIAAAAPGEGVLVLADNYPTQYTPLDAGLFQTAEQKQLRLYVEYPGYLPGMAIGGTQTVTLQRAVVTSGFFGPSLQPLRILSPQQCVFQQFTAANADLVLAQVAGYDTAIYGLPTTTYPLLFQLEPGAQNGPVLVASTKLSQMLNARFEPVSAWQSVWRSILAWVSPGSHISLNWMPAVHPAYGPNANLPENAEQQAMELGIDWFNQSRLLIDASRTNALAQANAGSGTIAAPPADAPQGDGSLGILEGYNSAIQPDGSQLQSAAVRGDCVCESAMSLALGSCALSNAKDAATAERLLDYWYFVSPGCQGERGDSNNPSFGLSAWGISTPAWYVANYGDDNARVMLATMAAAGALNDDHWDEKLLLGLLANLRTSDYFGFRGDRIDQGALDANGWEYYFWGQLTNCAPHYESYLWACYLWAYNKTGYTLFRDRAETAIRITMEQYPDGWIWSSGAQDERAHMLLPLAWLVRVDDTTEHRAWLFQMATNLLQYQDASGAIEEQLGPPNSGFLPPESNAAYGTAEGPLLQENGDPVSDLLYTCNFAFLGLHEAAAATGNPFYSQAENKLADFLTRIQSRSSQHPELNGAWLRGFDFQLWDYWASSSDAGWGAWSMETGWMQSWISSVFAMRQLNTSLWDLTAQSQVGRFMDKWGQFMIPDSVLNGLQQTITNDAVGKPITLATQYSSSYPGSGPATLVDDTLGCIGQFQPDWLGFHGNDLDATIDLGQPTQINQIGMDCLQSVGSGIYVPLQVEFFAGNDPSNLTELQTVPASISQDTPGPVRAWYLTGNLDVQTRYVRVVAQNIGVIPSGKPGAGSSGWLFVDEIAVNP
ncbi:MAG: lamin tail domain-containing protein [Limisphaerales bacterium]